MGDFTGFVKLKLKAEKDKHDQEYRQGMKTLQMIAPYHLQGLFIEHEKKLNALLQSEDAIFQEFYTSEAFYQLCQNKLDEDTQMYTKNELKLRLLFFKIDKLNLRKFAGKFLKLSEEQKALRKRIIARKHEIGAREIEKMRCIYNLFKCSTAEDDIQGMKNVQEMAKDVREMEGELEQLKL